VRLPFSYNAATLVFILLHEANFRMELISDAGALKLTYYQARLILKAAPNHHCGCG
jgi:hypothetical protein